MEELDFSNITDGSDLDLFGTETTETKTEEQNEKNEQVENTEDYVNPDTLFGGDDSSESVGEEDNQGTQENPVEQESNTGNSSADFYSSIASALRADGVLEYLDDDGLAAITDADTFKTAIETEMNNRFDARQRELYEALGYGADVQELKQLQDSIVGLEEIDVDQLSKDGDETAENTRKQLIYMDFILRGFDQQKAAKEVEKSFNAGTDIEDAKDALEYQKNYFKQVYQGKIEEAKKQEEQRQAEIQSRWNDLEKNVMENEEPFEGVRIDKRTREKILENVMMPTVLGEDGRYYSKMQDYQNKHPNEFMQKVGTIFTLTDGFKNLDKLVNKIVKKEKNNNIRELENVLKNQTNRGGAPRYVSNGYTNKTSNDSRYSLNI